MWISIWLSLFLGTYEILCLTEKGIDNTSMLKKYGTGHTAHITEKRITKCVLIFRIFYLIMLFTREWVSLTFYTEGHRMNWLKNTGNSRNNKE